MARCGKPLNNKFSASSCKRVFRTRLVLFDALELSSTSITIIETKLEALKNQIRQLSAADRTLPKHRRQACDGLGIKTMDLWLVAQNRRNSHLDKNT